MPQHNTHTCPDLSVRLQRTERMCCQRDEYHPMNSFSFLSQSAFVSAGLHVGERAVHTHNTVRCSTLWLGYTTWITLDLIVITLRFIFRHEMYKNSHGTYLSLNSTPLCANVYRSIISWHLTSNFCLQWEKGTICIHSQVKWLLSTVYV